MFIIPPDSYRDGGGTSIVILFQMGVDKKLNRITERTRVRRNECKIERLKVGS
ncbi:MAG TPA: hypothetical protein VFH07_11560 [Chitinophagaceae bacterium]|nr:hypothetical protein [Chitinophagaceae bacterium]